MQSDAGSVAFNNRTYHFARDSVSTVYLVLSNFYVLSGVGGQTEQSPGDMPVRASIESSGGSFAQFLWSGSIDKILPALSVTRSDALSFSLTSGDKFYIRIFATSAPAGSIYTDCDEADANTNGPQMSVTGGDALEISGVDKTMSGTVVDSGFEIIYWPSAIVAESTKRAYYFLGDSRVAGFRSDGTVNDCGQFSVPLGPQNAYINLGIGSDDAAAFLASHTLRLQLAQYCTHILSDLGAADYLLLGQSAAVTESRITSVAALFSPKPFYQATFQPATDGAWTLVDGSDQTVDPTESVRLQINADIRAGVINGVTGFVDIASFLEQNAHLGKWKADGTPAKYTVDGLHQTYFGNQQIVISIPDNNVLQLPTIDNSVFMSINM